MAATATAASKAFPPFASMRIPASVAGARAELIIPDLPSAGCLSAARAVRENNPQAHIAADAIVPKFLRKPYLSITGGSHRQLRFQNRHRPKGSDTTQHAP